MHTPFAIFRQSDTMSRVFEEGLLSPTKTTLINHSLRYYFII